MAEGDLPVSRSISEYSQSGEFWWDGQQWIPISQQALPLTGPTGDQPPDDYSDELRDHRILKDFLINQPKYVIRRTEDLDLHDESSYRWTHTIQIQLSEEQRKLRNGTEFPVSIGIYPKFRLPDLVVTDESASEIPILHRQDRLEYLVDAAFTEIQDKYAGFIISEYLASPRIASLANDLLSQLYFVIDRIVDEWPHRAEQQIGRFFGFLWLMTAASQSRLPLDVALELAHLPELMRNTILSMNGRGELNRMIAELHGDTWLREKLKQLQDSTQILVLLKANGSSTRLLNASYSDHIRYSTTTNPTDDSVKEDADRPNPDQALLNQCASSKSSLMQWLGRLAVFEPMASPHRWVQLLVRPSMAKGIRTLAIIVLRPAWKLVHGLDRFCSALGMTPQLMSFTSANADHCWSYYALIGCPEGAAIVRCYWRSQMYNVPLQTPRVHASKVVLHWESGDTGLGGDSTAYFEVQLPRRDAKWAFALSLGAAIISLLLVRRPEAFVIRSSDAGLASILILIPGDAHPGTLDTE